MSGEPIVRIYDELKHDREILRDALVTISMLLGDGEYKADYQGLKTIVEMALTTVPNIYEPLKPRDSWEFPKPAN